MNFLQAFILGIVEGVTEYLPVSSTGHLIIVSSLMDLKGEAIKTFEVVIQVGAILAVLGLYRNRVTQMGQGLFGKNSSGLKLLINLFISFLPAAILGLALHKKIKEHLFFPIPVGLALAVGGVIMILSDVFYKKGDLKKIDIESISIKKAVIIGLVQCFALWPGTSRSMATILGGLIIGLNRKDAAEYSFLLALPTLSAACFFDLIKGGGFLFADVGMINFFTGMIVSGIVAAIAIKGFVAWLTKHGFAPFGWYRIIIAVMVWLVWRAS